jgi:hypothetical protein
MKFRIPEIFLGVFLAVAIFAMGFLFASSVFPPNAKPETAAQEHSKQEASKASTDERIAEYTWWLAVLTGGLVFVAVGQGVFIARSDKTARIAATAADLSARAAVAIELPVIRAAPHNFAYGSSMDGDNPRIDWCVLAYVNFLNVGRTQAFPIELRCGWTVGDKLPDVPAYTGTKAFPIDLIFKPNDEEPDRMRINDFDLKFEPGVCDKVRSNTASLWFYCSLVYLDFMQTRHEAGFCWQRHEITGGGVFLPDATPAYNQKT